jgi:hypothetical protein
MFGVRDALHKPRFTPPPHTHKLRHGLQEPGFDSRYARDIISFSKTLPDRLWGSNKRLTHVYRMLFSWEKGVKRPGCEAKRFMGR